MLSTCAYSLNLVVHRPGNSKQTTSDFYYYHYCYCYYVTSRLGEVAEGVWCLVFGRWVGGWWNSLQNFRLRNGQLHPTKRRSRMNAAANGHVRRRLVTPTRMPSDELLLPFQDYKWYLVMYNNNNNNKKQCKVSCRL